MADPLCPPTASGTGPAQPIPCPDAPHATTGWCLPGGVPVVVFTRSDCGINPGEITGWIDLTTGAWTPGDPPATIQPCGATRDVEIAGRLCQVNATTGTFEASVFIEATFDTSVTPPVATGYQLTAVLADGTVTTGYSVPAGSTLDVCPAGTAEPVAMCDTATSTQFVRWYNSITGSVLFDRDASGVAYAPTGPLVIGPCPATPEFDTTSVTPWQVCAAGVPTLVRQYWTTDNTTGIPTPGGLEWSTDGGQTWQLPPLPVPVIAGACPASAELDVIAYAPFPVCVDGVTWYARQTATVDNLTGLATAAPVEYSADGAAWSATVPGVTIVAGACVPAEPPDVNAFGITPYALCVDCVDTLARQVATVDETTGAITYAATEYSTDGGVSWTTTVPAGTITPGPCARCCPQVLSLLDVVEVVTPGGAGALMSGTHVKFDGGANPVGASLGNDFDPADAAAIAAAVPVGGTFTIICVDENGAGTFTISATLNAPYAGGSNLDLLVAVEVSPAGTGFNPTGPFQWFVGTVAPAGPELVDYTCTPFMRTLTTACDGTVTVADLGLDGLPYVPVGVVTTGGCPECEPVERAVCIDDGAGTIIEGYQTICRNPDGSIRWIRLEDADGNVITGTVVDCSCAPAAIPLLNKLTYTGRGIAGNVQNKFSVGCGPVTWVLNVYQGTNDTPIYTSSTSPALASIAAAQAWVAANSGGYATIDTVQDPDSGLGQNSWSLPVSGQYLIVITETAGGVCTSPCFYCVANWDIAAIGGNGWWDAISHTPIIPSTVGMAGWVSGT